MKSYRPKVLGAGLRLSVMALAASIAIGSCLVGSGVAGAQESQPPATNGLTGENVRHSPYGWAETILNGKKREHMAGPRYLRTPTGEEIPAYCVDPFVDSYVGDLYREGKWDQVVGGRSKDPGKIAWILRN
ncbi:hypothetical protein, partial [Streptomyces formicae]